jgi:hypothetical protein
VYVSRLGFVHLCDGKILWARSVRHLNELILKYVFYLIKKVKLTLMGPPRGEPIKMAGHPNG